MAVLEDQLRHAERRRRGEQVHQHRRRGGDRRADDEQQQREAHRDHEAVDERQPAGEGALEIARLGGRAADERAVRQPRAHAVDELAAPGDGTHPRQREAAPPLRPASRRRRRGCARSAARTRPDSLAGATTCSSAGAPAPKACLQALGADARARVGGQDAGRRHRRAQAEPRQRRARRARRARVRRARPGGARSAVPSARTPRCGAAQHRPRAARSGRCAGRGAPAAPAAGSATRRARTRRRAGSRARSCGTAGSARP